MDRPKAPVVLVVEDEPLVLKMALDIIEDAGLEVLSAVNADEAMAILDSRDDIGIIFTNNLRQTPERRAAPTAAYFI
jgi:CheY-like chemotaxis protein